MADNAARKMRFAAGDDGREKNGPRIRRPEDEILHRPSLKVKSIPAPELEQTEGSAAAPQPRKGLRKIALPSEKERQSRLAFATHGMPPPDRDAEKETLTSLNNSPRERELSSGFVLGVALILLALVGGIFVARLRSRVSALERRVVALESGQHAGTEGD